MINKDIYKFEKQDYLTDEALLTSLNSYLIGKSYLGLPLRTRSKVVKTDICKALGYEIPKSFKKTKPKFPCQNFDIYVQESNNLQIWNQEIDENRRYVIMQLNSNHVVTKIKIIHGSELIKLDTTNKLTIKYQARVPDFLNCHYTDDNEKLIPFLTSKLNIDFSHSSTMDDPNKDSLLPISVLYNSLLSIKNKKIQFESYTKERTLADLAQEIVATQLGYNMIHDDGQYPDIKHQLLEIKLQMTSTIDLGMHCPDSKDYLSLSIDETPIEIDMCRYVILIAHREDSFISIDDIIIASGNHFFEIFTLFGGKVKNTKIQIPLPKDFFD